MRGREVVSDPSGERRRGTFVEGGEDVLGEEADLLTKGVVESAEEVLSLSTVSEGEDVAA